MNTRTNPRTSSQSATPPPVQPSSTGGPNGATQSSKSNSRFSRSFPGVPQSIIDEYGLPFFTNSKRLPATINEAFWAALYAHENRILYEPDEGSFFAYNPATGLYLKESTDLIRTKKR